MEEILIGLIIAALFGFMGLGFGAGSKEDLWTADCSAHGLHIASKGEMYKCEKVK